MSAKRITRAATVDDLRDLLHDPHRAHLAFVQGGAVQARPVKFTYHDGRFLVAARGVQPGTVVCLLLDDGVVHSELRGVRVTGALVQGEDGALEVTPGRVAAWDYGAMRPRA